MLRNQGRTLDKQEQKTLLELHQSSFFKLLLKGLSRHQVRQLTNLADELNNNTQSALGVPKHSRRLALSLRSKQSQWQTRLQSELAQAKSVVVVGNSPKLLESSQGAFIDSHDLVIRFNQFLRRTDEIYLAVSVKNLIFGSCPGFRGPIPEHARYILITGPNMVWWQQNWQHLACANCPILGIPLTSWKTSVARLDAPPSAGFACLDWLINDQRIENIRPRALGFGYNPTQQSRYHIQNDVHRATSRHNWRAEQEVIETEKRIKIKPTVPKLQTVET